MTTDGKWLAEEFERSRRRLQRVASRMLGSRSEAEDAVQDAWMRVSCGGADAVQNLDGWLTTVVARVCLDRLRARVARREVAEEEAQAQPQSRLHVVSGPQDDAELADSVGQALLVVLETLGPAERVVFVLHDMFEMTFEQIAPIVGRSADATRQLGSRARRRVRGGAPAPDADLGRRREIVGAFLAAAREGNFEGLIEVLDPSVVLRADSTAVATAAASGWGSGPALTREARGARAVAHALRGRGRGVSAGLIDGAPGAVLVLGGQVRAVWVFTFGPARITAIELVMEPERLARLEVEA